MASVADHQFLITVGGNFHQLTLKGNFDLFQCVIGKEFWSQMSSVHFLNLLVEFFSHNLGKDAITVYGYSIGSLVQRAVWNEHLYRIFINTNKESFELD